MSKIINRAMVLAAGLGTRMRPLTDDRCKALVEVGGRTLIDHMLDRLHAAGVNEAIVNVHAFADKLEQHLARRSAGPKIIISDEREELLETGGCVVKALPLLGDEPIFICNIDAVWIEFEDVMGQLLSAWDPDKMDELLLLAPRKDCLGYHGKGDFDLAADGRLSRRAGEHADWVYAGVQVFKPPLASGYDVKPFSRNEIWTQTLSRRTLYGLPMKGYWMHVGDPRARLAAQAILTQEATPKK